MNPQGLGKRRLEQLKKTLQPDLGTHMRAAYLLIQDLEYACLRADGLIKDPPKKGKR